MKGLKHLFEKEEIKLAYLFGSLAEESVSSSRPPGDVDLAGGG